MDDSVCDSEAKMVNFETEKISEIIKEIKATSPLFKIKLAPLHVPPQRRLQTFAALFWISHPLIFGPLFWLLAIYLAIFSNVIKAIIAIYLIWLYTDRDVCEKGGRRWEWYRRLKLWEYYRDFFPAQLVKTVDLPADKNYLFAVFPHGILSSGAFCAFATESLHFEKVFKGLKVYVATLKLNFSVPIVRDLALGMGLIAASKESLNWSLGSPGKGRATVLVVGGAAEAMYNKPGVYRIVLKNRKGFCKVALQNGSPLVPVFTFGEIDLYEQYVPQKNSAIDQLQHWVKKVTGVAPVIFFGRGIFNYSFGFIPRRVPLTVVVGKPIDVEKVDKPTEEQVNELHLKFRESLVNLFNEEKHKYLEDPTTELIID